jgi:hypothetical protein
MNTRKSSVTALLLLFSLLQQALATDTGPLVPSPAELDDPVFPATLEMGATERASILRLKPQTFETQKGAETTAGLSDDFLGSVRINPAC